MIRLLSLAALVAILTGCAAATPLLVAEAGGHQIARINEDIKVRGAAALQDEPDLLTYSVHAISRNKAEDAVNIYMKGYNAPEYSDNMKSLALYQVALLYMNRFNEQRNDAKALQLLNKHLAEFPQSRLRPRILDHINIIEARKASGIQLSAKELLKQVDRVQLMNKEHFTMDSEMTDMSERAISDNRVDDAELVYLILYENKASSEEMRANALYQIGLIYMSPYNQSGDNAKALGYFRKITTEFPKTQVAKKAQRHVSDLINKQ